MRGVTDRVTDRVTSNITSDITSNVYVQSVCTMIGANGYPVSKYSGKCMYIMYVQ